MSTALQLISAYGSDSDDHDLVNDEELQQCVQKVLYKIIAKVEKGEMRQSAEFTNFRFTSNCDEISVSSASSLSLSDEEIFEEEEETGSRLPPRTQGELGLEDLPPIERLNIQARVEDLSHVGRVASIIDCLVSVQSFKGQPALDLDSVLFLKDGSPMGSIFEVFGPVKEPRYLIRFNSRKEIDERNLKVDVPVYCSLTFGAPITAYVFTSDLMKMKGSDASWKHNNEPPQEIHEFSDDEEEKRHQQKNKAKRKFNPNQGMTRKVNYSSPSSLRAPPNTPVFSFNSGTKSNVHGPK